MSNQRNETPINSLPNQTPGGGKYIPKDAQVIIAIMKEFGIHEYEQRVINVLLEFIYKYTTTVLDDARLFATHSKKKTIETDDVKLAISMQNDRLFSSAPPREMLMELARNKNSMPLPSIKIHAGIKLPPDRYCLMQTNYRLKYTVGGPIKKKNGLGRSSQSISSSTSSYVSSTTSSSVFTLSSNSNAAKDSNSLVTKATIKQMPTIPSQNSSSFNIADIKFSS